jgi:NADH-quinone oxidoreductase subunit N
MADLRLMLPELILFAWSMLILMYGINRKESGGNTMIYLSMLGLVIAGFAIPFTGYGVAFGGTFFVDPVSVFFKMIFLGAAFFAVASSSDFVEKLPADRGEFFTLILLSTIGMMFLVSTGELITLYVALELTTIPLFILAAYRKDSLQSSEAGLKYLILGAVSSAILLYGISMIYGLTGSTFLTVAFQRILEQSLGMLTLTNEINMALAIGMIMMIAGFGFKLALVPFHMWAPDVYEGAPTPVTSFLSVASKGAGIAAFARVFYLVLPSFNEFWWGIIIAVLAAAAMIVGNITAVMQSNVKRMLAYSSIAHAGYMLIGFVSLPATANDTAFGPASIMFYMLAYLFANMGAFACAIAFAKNFGSYEIKDYQGLAKESPALSLVFTIFLLSLAGIPPMVGFFAKYYIFLAGWPNYSWLVIVGILTSVIALYYYANIIKQMYFNRTETALVKARFDRPLLITLVLTVAGTILFGIFPESVIKFATSAFDSFPF